MLAIVDKCEVVEVEVERDGDEAKGMVHQEEVRREGLGEVGRDSRKPVSSNPLSSSAPASVYSLASSASSFVTNNIVLEGEKEPRKSADFVHETSSFISRNTMLTIVRAGGSAAFLAPSGPSS